MRISTRSLLAVAVLAAATLGPAGAATAAEGTVVGTVSGPDGRVEGVCVNVHNPADDLGSYVQAMTNENGRFSVSTEAGTVRVRLHDCDGAANGSLAQEWYDDASSFDDADIVTVRAGETTALGAIELEAGGTIRGTVEDQSGNGIAGACVTVTDPTRPEISVDATADGNGNYTAAGLPAGIGFVVQARDCGNVPAQQATAWYRDGGIGRGPGDATRVTLAAGSRATIDVVLPDAGTIRGTAVDATDNTTFEFACVTAIDLGSSTTHGDLAADGSFEISGLLPGQWILRIMDCSQPDDPEDLLETLYMYRDPGSGGLVTTPDVAKAKANPIVVGAGTTSAGNVFVSPGGAVSGRVIELDRGAPLDPTDTSGEPFGGACVYATPSGSRSVAASTVSVANPDGQYTLGGLSPDTSYNVFATDCEFPRRFGLEWSNSALLSTEAQLVQVQAGQTVTGRTIRVGDMVRRAAGGSRIETAIALALGAFDEANTVLLARADAYPDALAGAPLAASLNGPVLLTGTDALDARVADAIQSLGASKVILLGGTAALSPTVQAQAEDLPGVTADRIAGSNRFDTARRIADRLPSSDVAYVVEGANPDPNRGWPDAVAVSGLAALEQAPLLLVTRDSVPQNTQRALSSTGVSDITIVGGPAAVSNTTAGTLSSLVPGSATRVFGADRFATSEAVVQLSLARGAWTRTLWLATGTNYPDALVAGAVVGQDGGILKLVNGPDAAASPSFEASMQDRATKTDRVILLGGTAAISTRSENQVRTILGPG